MRFFEWLILEMDRDEAIRILDVGADGDFVSAYKKASMRNHPDRGGDEAYMKRINRAFELLSGEGSNIKPNRKPRETYSNLDYCLRVIEEESIKNGVLGSYTFWAWDGFYFRGVFTARTNSESFSFAAKVMEMWNDSFPHDTKAVFVSIGEKELLLLRLNREDVSAGGRIFTHESFNSNPGNDLEFVGMLRKSL
jgi:curved DNA-binding protein CbpA